MKTGNVDQFLLSDNQAGIFELDDAAIDLVGGGYRGGALAMGFAGGWASTVTGFAVGVAVGGIRGGMIGGAAGFAVGALIAVGYQLASGGGGSKKGKGSLINPT